MTSINLKAALQGNISESELVRVVRGYDVVGDIAVIIIPQEIEDLQSQIGQALLASRPDVRAVAKRKGHYGGEYRKIGLEKIAGNGGLETMHKEFGVRLLLNPAEVYFSPRSASERHRIATLVQPGEKVLVMFSGIGPLPLMISRHSDAEIIVGIEKNPEAHSFAVKNVAINKHLRNVTLLQGDAAEVLPTLDLQFDRIAMPLPSAAREFVAEALQGLKTGGWLHYYDFQQKDEFDRAALELRRVVERHERRVLSIALHKCGHISPGKYRICIDAQIH